LAALAGGPVLWAYSDFGRVRIARPGAEPVDFWLHPSAAEAYGQTVDPAEQDAAGAVVGAWPIADDRPG
jgi:hypothetical protein